MSQCFFGNVFGEAAAQVERPQRFQCQLAPAFQNPLTQDGDSGGVAAVAQKTQGGLAEPAIVVSQQPDELKCGFLAQVEGGRWLGVLASEPIDSAGVPVDLALKVAEVSDMGIAEIGNVKAVGPVADIDGTEPWIFAGNDRPNVLGLDGRAVRLDVAEHDLSLKRQDREQLTQI